MKIEFPKNKLAVAELIMGGRQVMYVIPPVIGTYFECFSFSDDRTRTAQGIEIAAFVYGAFFLGNREWADQPRIRFPTLNYLRVPEILTMVPNKKEFGDLAGAMLVDSDLTGEGLSKITEVPANFDGWAQTPQGLMIRDNRIAVPMSKWYSNRWDAKNGAVIALFGDEGAKVLEKAYADSGSFWKVDVKAIQTPEKRVPVIRSYDGLNLVLDCSDKGGGENGCAIYVLK